jgi:hypothetical protein
VHHTNTRAQSRTRATRTREHGRPGKCRMWFLFQYSSVYKVTEPKADGAVGVDVVRRLIYCGSPKAEGTQAPSSQIGALHTIGIRGMHGMGLLLGKRALARSALPAAPRKSHWQVQFWCITPAGSFWRATATMSPAPSTTASFRPDFVPGCARCMWRSSSWRAVSGGGWSFQDNG